MKIKPWHYITPEDRDTCKGTKGGFYLFHVARLVESNSCLKYMKVFPKFNLYYIYDRDQGIYIEMSPSETKSFISQLAFSIDQKRARVKVVMGIFYSELLYGPRSLTGDPCFERRKISFLNGTLDLYTCEFGQWSFEYFTTYRLNYVYDPQATCPNIHKFLLSLCNGHEDRVHFLQYWLYSLLNGMTMTQTLLYMWGLDGTGKSTFAHLVTAFIGKEST